MIRTRGYKNAHAGSRTRVTSMGGLYDTATLHALTHAFRIAKHSYNECQGAKLSPADADLVTWLVSGGV